MYTVAFKESSLNPQPKKNKSYRGLFQIGDLAWQQLKKINPKDFKGGLAPLEPKKNAQAGHDYLAWAYDLFEKKIKQPTPDTTKLKSPEPILAKK